MPEITVLMPVRNGERYIKESIDSVLNQTLTDFEFLRIYRQKNTFSQKGASIYSKLK